jgi:UDP-N-acetylmuramyl pentapeptide phosphotransferase/UDP-N-acetylglucosamine-1-phosphate transferase
MVLLLTFWFMAVPNALNIEDAINGYMGGFTFIVLLALRLRGLDTGIPMGAMAGFLVLNWPRARHFMGDAGSFGCGFLIAEEILRAGALDHPLLALVLTAPISLDVAMGLIRRHRLGMSPMAPDRCTCPHHVLSLCNGSPILATPFLLLLTVGFVFAVDRPTLAAGLAILYSGGLVWLNRRHLFLSPVRYHLEVKQERPPERQVDLATGTEILSCEEGTIRESQEVGCGSGLSE